MKALFILGAILAVLSCAEAGRTETVKSCLNAAETREAVLAHKLVNPTEVLHTAASHARAEPLRSRLCRWNEDYVYEITLLRRDGKVMHVDVRADDGKVTGAKNDR